jgi:hypothetical protein
MAAGRIQTFFGDDWDETLDSLKSAPGAFGNIIVAAARQFRAVDVVAFGLVLTGLLWLIFGYFVTGHHSAAMLLLSLAPISLWFAGGLVGGLVFVIGGVGYRMLGYWEAYVLILFFSLFGSLSLRLALNPRDRQVYRPAPSAPKA